MATLKQALRNYFLLSICGLGGAYGYLHHQCKKRKDESMDFDLIQVRKDTSRPSNAYYGLNWGYRSDETIEKSLDTGDLLFFTYDCSKLFSPEETIICYKKQYLKQQELQNSKNSSLFDTDDGDANRNVGICIRTPKKLFVVHADLVNQIHTESYSDFLNKPFMKTVCARSFEKLPAVTVEKSYKYIEEIRAEEAKKQAAKENQDFFSSLWRAKFMQIFFETYVSGNVVANCLYAAKILKVDPYLPAKEDGKHLNFTNELWMQKPKVIHDAYKLSSPIMIRSVGQANVRK